MLLRPRFMMPVGAYAGAAGFSPTSTESSNFLTRATTITNDTDKTNYDALISGLVTDGDFSSLDALYIWAAPDRTAAVLNLIQNAYNATEAGTVSFSAYVGYTGNGTDFALDSGLNPFSASSPQYTLNSASIGIYVQTDSNAGAGLGAVGADNVGKTVILPAYFGSTYYNVNGPQRSVAAASTQGLRIATRTASNAVAIYKNGNTTPVDSGTDASDAVPRADINFFFSDGSNYSSLQMSAGFIGGGLSSAAMARIAARLNTFMTAYGINVY